MSTRTVDEWRPSPELKRELELQAMQRLFGPFPKPPRFKKAERAELARIPNASTRRTIERGYLTLAKYRKLGKAARRSLAQGCGWNARLRAHPRFAKELAAWDAQVLENCRRRQERRKVPPKYRKPVKAARAERDRLTRETGVAHVVDHRRALALGGTHAAENLRVITADANSKKAVKETGLALTSNRDKKR